MTFGTTLVYFHNNPSDGSLFQAERHEDGRTDMTQLIFDFLNCFEKSTKMFGVSHPSVFLRVFPERLCKATVYSIMSVHLPAQKSTSTERIFVKFHTGGLH